jgi:hypothetical protein
MAIALPKIIPIEKYKNHDIDLSDFEKEEHIDDTLDKFSIQIMKLSRLNKSMTRYDSSSGTGDKNLLASAVLRHLYELFLDFHVDLYSVVYVFENIEHYFSSLKDMTGYPKTINRPSFGIAKRKLRKFECLRVSNDDDNPLKVKGYEGKFLIQLKTPKFD